MPEREVMIDGIPYSSNHVIEVISDAVQRDIVDPNMSETAKDASVDTAVEILSQIPPPDEP